MTKRRNYPPQLVEALRTPPEPPKPNPSLDWEIAFKSGRSATVTGVLGYDQGGVVVRARDEVLDDNILVIAAPWDAIESVSRR